MENAKKIVVDASVAAKWYVTEESSDKALALRDDFRSRKLDLLSPHLFIYEVANGLRYSPELSPRDILDAVDSLVSMQISLVNFDPLQWKRAVRNALSLQISLYDSAYYTTAEVYSLKLVTADKRLFRRLQGKNLILLDDYDYSRL